MNAVELRNVSLALGGRAILDDISLDIAAGEFVGVLGPNGAGKTTLLRAILGLLPPRRGAIRVFGRAATRGSAEIGYMPQTRSAAAGLLLSGRTFLAAAVNGHRLGLPLPGKAQRAEIDQARARRRGGLGRAAACATLRWRAPALAAGSSADRPAAPLAARRAAHQPRSAPSGRGGRLGGIAATDARHHRPLQHARAQSVARRGRSRALSRQWPGRTGHRRGGDHRARPVASLWRRDRGGPPWRPDFRDVGRSR